MRNVGRAVFAALLLYLVTLQKELFCAVMFSLNKELNVWGFFFQKLYSSKLKLIILHFFSSCGQLLIWGEFLEALVGLF